MVLTSPQANANTFAVPAAPVIKKATVTPQGVRVVFNTVTASPAVTGYVLSGGAGSCPITVPAATKGVVTLPIIEGKSA